MLYFLVPLSSNLVPFYGSVWVDVRFSASSLTTCSYSWPNSMTDWFFFMVLDIGNAATEAIPLGTRFLVGLFQGIAVRAAGFSAISVAELAAAVK